jgi:hypothetical protein
MEPIPSSAEGPTKRSIPTSDGKWERWDLSLWETESSLFPPPRNSPASPSDDATVVYFSNPRTRQAMRMRKEEANKKWAMMIAFLIAPVIGLLALLISMSQPKIVAPERPFKVVPSTQPTATASVPRNVRIDKSKLIIQQNVNCWLGGQPGATCNPGIRTYV